MLKLTNISKIYELGKKGDKKHQIVNALKNVNIEFRKSEFVSILGPSGCGKTTLLNIIGGLDRYTDGDLIISGKSTKTFKDKDWDTYRNHSVGFVFQSYNLIPHLTVIQNVELALTLSGIKPEERRVRATEVLSKVGLADKINSKPNQLSGGQMQRVAIARALVNDPEIILADEPTGALDSKTSVQIMELLKEIAKERLIVMVTHNPELANKYSTRIIKLLDGEVEGDSMPYDSSQLSSINSSNKNNNINNQKNLESDSLLSLSDDKNLTDEQRIKKSKKKNMSYFTAISLSLKNLFTKKARTFLVSFAGSIGIIGIALILSLSSGFQTYINSVQEDTLSTYPITINSATMDYSTLFNVLMNANAEENKKPTENAITSDDVIVNMFQSILNGSKSNDLKSFKEYIESEAGEQFNQFITGIQYTYNLNLNIYDSQTQQLLNPNSMFYDGIMAWLEGMAVKQLQQTNEYKSLQEKYFQDNPNPDDNLTQPSDVTYKMLLAYPTTAIEFAPMLKATMEQLIAQITGIMGGGSSGNIGGMNMGMNNFESLKNSDLGLWTEIINNPTLINNQYDIVALTPDKQKSTLIESLKYNEIVLVQDKNGYLGDYALYALGLKTSPTIEEIASGLVNSKDYEIQPTIIPYSEILGKTYTLLADTDYFVYKTTNGSSSTYSLTYSADAVLVDIRTELTSSDAGSMTQQQYDEILEQIKQTSGTTLTIKGILSPKQNVSATSISGAIGYSNALTQFMAEKIDNTIQEKGSTILGGYRVDMSNPTSISIYCIDFEAKSEIENLIKQYNSSVDEEKQIAYTDYVSLMMDSVSVIINAITYVLISFVGVSLIVSSIMIGVITYISVLERTKEIGVLRSIGASKKDIKRVFTAESVIIGFCAGGFGILVTLVLTIPINIIINALAGIGSVAMLPWLGGIILILISMFLTFIAGLIPARIASKKDPVIALRTE